MLSPLIYQRDHNFNYLLHRKIGTRTRVDDVWMEITLFLYATEKIQRLKSKVYIVSNKSSSICINKKKTNKKNT